MVKDLKIFMSSVFFVLGFSVVFSIVGVLLQSVLAGVSFTVQAWLARIGGLVIIFFGLYLLGLIRIPFLDRDYKLEVKKKFHSSYIASFVFGAAFAVGWTPCVGAVLGAVLTLAITQPGTAFFMLLAYSLGLGIPFLLAGLFINQARSFIRKSRGWIKYLNYIFGVILIMLGILVFVNQLSSIANIAFISQWLTGLQLGGVSGASLNIGIAFIAGILSLLSPCVLPLIPAFLSYLAAIGVKDEKERADAEK